MSNPGSNHSWLDYLSKFFEEFTSRQWRRFLSRLLMSIIVALIVSFLVLYCSMKFLGLRVEEGKLYLGVYESNLPGAVIVDSTAGWKDSGIELKEKDTVHIEVSGRVHLAMVQIINLAVAAKPLIVDALSDQELQELKRLSGQDLKGKYPLGELDSTNRFYRRWIGPEGDSSQTASDMLNRCRLDYEQTWGKLLATVIPKDIRITGQRDPFAVLKDANVKPSELKAVADGTGDFKFNKAGKLVFIINEAVISPLSPSEFPECKKYYEALSSKATSPQDREHQLDSESIPLIWFADNVGSFHVVVRHKT